MLRLGLSCSFILLCISSIILKAVAAPHFPIPESASIVDVKMLDAMTSVNPGSAFWNTRVNTVPTKSSLELAGYAFLLEHPSTGRRVLFDLGMRKDTENLAPAVLKLFASVTPGGVFPFNVNKDIPDQLVEGNVSLSSIDTIIWSHSHFDHVGDMSKLPASTRLLVGAGTLANALPGYPEDPSAFNLAADFQGHNATEIQWDGVKIAGQRSHDFFGDGSLFLLDMPGHVDGHLAALARVSVNPSTFVFLAGDSEHTPALMRPTSESPLPEDVIRSLPLALQAYGAPDYADPFLFPTPQNGSVNQDVVMAYATLDKVKRFDARDDVWVIISHDPSLKAAVPGTAAMKDEDAITLFPGSLNDWKKKGWKESSKFAFLEAGNRGNVFLDAEQV